MWPSVQLKCVCPACAIPSASIYTGCFLTYQKQEIRNKMVTFGGHDLQLWQHGKFHQLTLKYLLQSTQCNCGTKASQCSRYVHSVDQHQFQDMCPHGILPVTLEIIILKLVILSGSFNPLTAVCASSQRHSSVRIISDQGLLVIIAELLTSATAINFSNKNCYFTYVFKLDSH